MNYIFISATDMSSKTIFVELFIVRAMSCFLLVVGLSSTVSSQTTSFSLGLSQRTERSTYQNDEFVKNKNNYLFVGVEREKENHSWSFGFSFYQAEIAIDSYSSRSNRNSSSGGSSYYSSKVFSKANVSYAFLGAKIQRVNALMERKRFTLNLGCFFHLEKLVSEEEANHSQYNSSYSEVTYPGFESETTTIEPTTYDEFDAVLLKNVFWSFGAIVAPKFTRKNYFISPYFSIGIHPKWRAHDNMAYRSYHGTSANRGPYTNNDVSERRNIYVFQEIGITVGRSNKKK